MEKVNKKIIDEENKTITIIRDFETDKKVEGEVKERYCKEGFKTCLREMKSFFKFKSTVYGSVEADFKEHLEKQYAFYDLLWFDDLLEILQSICEKEVEKAIQNKK